MTTARKFDFNVSFDGQGGPTHAGGHVDRATQAKIEEAFNRGREAGHAEASASVEHQLAAALGTISERLADLEATRTEIEAAFRTQATVVARKLVGKLFPALAAREALTEVSALLSECLTRVLEEPRIVVRVADPLLDPLREKMDDLASRSGYSGDIVLLAESDLGPSDCRVEWADGGAERDVERLWSEISETIARSLSPSAADSAPPDSPNDPSQATTDQT